MARGIWYSTALSFICKYRLVRRLGAGGMGEVYLAEDTELERSVALKLMSAELAQDPEKRKRFRMEAKAASGLVHPHVCVIHEVGEAEDGRPFLAMEYIEGQTLDRVLQQRRFRVREVITLGIEVADALEAARGRGIVHRDIKPANIMFDARGGAKVLDFGLAKRFTRDELGAESTSVAQTKSGMMIGTPHYMSPEQVLGRDLDHRSDIFSLGTVLYEAITGHRPFSGRTVGEVLNNVVNQKPQPLGLENPLYSPALDEIVFKSLEKDPEKRYGSAKALKEDLLRLRQAAERAASVPEAEKPLPAPAAAASTAAPKLWELVHRRPAVAGGLKALAAVAVLLAIAAVFLFAHNPPNPARKSADGLGATGPQKSVAVLPFDNFTGEPENEYLSDGLTEEITSALSRIPGLKVAARNSAFTFKGKKEDARQIAEALHVGTLLEGSIRKSGKQLRVSAQLINAADGYQIWSVTYEATVDDVFQVQEEIARRIAENLQGGGGFVAAKAADPKAYKLYLKARVQWNKRTAAGVKNAIDLFKQAIEQDPTYAEAHAGLAASYLLMPEYVFPSRPSQFRPLAEAAANRALALNPRCSEAHAVLGELQCWRWDFKGAESHFQRAIQFDPNDATAHQWYGQLLGIEGRRSEALGEFQIALERDALSPVIHAALVEWYYLGNELDRAIEECGKVVQAFPDFPHVRTLSVMARIQKGQWDEALREIQTARDLQPEDPLVLLELKAYVLARSGRADEARQIQAQLQQARRDGQPTEGALIIVHAGFREYDQALDLLEQWQATEGLDPGLLVEPLLNDLRQLPRCQALIEKARISGTNAVRALSVRDNVSG